MNSLYGNYRTRTFCDIFPDYNTFEVVYRKSPLNISGLRDENLTILYYELYALYGNSHIASSDENQFKYKLFMIIFNKGLIWQRSLDIQAKLQNLSEEQILQSAKYLSSHAYNPGEGGEVIDGDTILQYINDQSSTKQSGPYIASMVNYMQSLVDVTSAFIGEFKKLFLTIVNPELPLWYVEDEDVEV